MSYTTPLPSGWTRIKDPTNPAIRSPDLTIGNTPSRSVGIIVGLNSGSADFYYRDPTGDQLIGTLSPDGKKFTFASDGRSRLATAFYNIPTSTFSTEASALSWLNSNAITVINNQRGRALTTTYSGLPPNSPSLSSVPGFAGNAPQPPGGTSLSGTGQGTGQTPTTQQASANLLNPLDAIASISEKYYNLDNDSVLNSFNKPLKYPLDLLDTGQDILVIQQFRYQPPRQDIFKDPKNILQNGIQRKSALRDKPLVQIFLPIPNNLQDSNNVSWGPDNMNNLTAAAAGAVLSKPGDYIASATTGALIGAISSALGLGGSVGSGAQLGAKFKMLADLYTSAQGSNEATALAGTALSSQILNMAGFEVSPESILANAAGLVPNSNLELLFNAPALREFRFDYRFSPRSEKEATTLRHIIRSFKQGMAPRKRNSSAGSASYFLATPNVFQLRYKTSNKEGIPGLNKFKICALTGFAVNYTPDGQWASYDGGQPVSYMVSMSFNELEPIYANDYSERIASGLENDLEPVGDDDIGY